MNLKIYQSYYDNSQLGSLSLEFIPFNNTENKEPNLREYPLWKKLYEEHKDTDDYWGLVSWRYNQKTSLTPVEFKTWILENPDYDVYHVDPFPDIAADYINVWTQGDRWCPGMVDFCNRLFPKLGINEKVQEMHYDADDFSLANYYVGNSKFWTSFINFLDHCIQICKEDKELNYYMFEKTIHYNGSQVPNFPFVTERLFAQHNILYKNEIKVHKVPIEHDCYKRSFGNYNALLTNYKNKQGKK
jgi:hypothetical protein